MGSTTPLSVQNHTYISLLLPSNDGVVIVIRCVDCGCFINDDVSSLCVNPDDCRTCSKRLMDQAMYCITHNKCFGEASLLMFCCIIDFPLKSYSVLRHSAAKMSSLYAVIVCLEMPTIFRLLFTAFFHMIICFYADNLYVKSMHCLLFLCPNILKMIFKNLNLMTPYLSSWFYETEAKPSNGTQIKFLTKSHI